MRGGISWSVLRESILEKINPGLKERRVIRDFCDGIEGELTAHLRDAGLRALAEVHGSVAKDTWLEGEKDIDVFIVLDPVYSRAELPRVIDQVKSYLGSGWVEAYAEHPYLQTMIDGFKVEFVPCFRVEPGGRLISATDRTPLHTKFVNDNLTLAGREEVKLLKQFMRGIAVYGAEVKVNGFSGYLCELLVIYIGPFEEILDAASSWRRNEVIETTGEGDPEELRKRFREPLIVIDPIDPDRNVASAVSDTTMWRFTAASRAFLKKPAKRFFFPMEDEVDPNQLLRTVRSRASDMMFILVEDSEVDVPDVLWGQLHKAKRAISRFLDKRDFHVIRSTAWSDEASKHLLIFELEDATIPQVMKIKGPPVEMAESSESFLRAHLGADSTLSGPWIEGRRWWVEKKRPYTDARSLIDSVLKDGGRSIGIPRRLSRKITSHHRILMDGEISSHIQGGFTRFLNKFMKGRPEWLE